MPSGSNPELRSIRAQYEHISAGFATKLADLREKGLAFNEEMQEREAKAKEEAEARRAENEAKAAAGKKPPERKAENPWAQPTRRPDAGALIGHFGDEDIPPVSPSTPQATRFDGVAGHRESSAPESASSASPTAAESRAPEVQSPAAPARGRHARADDFDDDFEGNSWLRG